MTIDDGCPYCGRGNCWGDCPQREESHKKYIKELLDKINKLEEALKFYADEKLWKDCAELDGGKKARKALKII
jgi:hypothetical protein